ncbi:MAG: hypothetical protein AAGE52_35505 [Myxococcota bacterium]
MRPIALLAILVACEASPNMMGELCGTEVCEVGQRCCGCGLCAAEGQACPAVGCDAGTPDGGLPRAFCVGDGESLSADCGPDEHCVFEEGCAGAGTCAPRPTTCPTDCPGVCGCDGVFYCNECVASLAGQVVDPAASCEAPSCEAMSAEGIGPCGAFFGYAWTGTECEPVNGCSCDGVDCEETFEDPTACNAAFQGCER